MSFYNTVEQNRNIYTLKCLKCGGIFNSNYKFSQRKSCRYHSYIRNNNNQMECLDCHKMQHQSNHNCYHIGESNILSCAIL